MPGCSSKFLEFKTFRIFIYSFLQRRTVITKRPQESTPIPSDTPDFYGEDVAPTFSRWKRTLAVAQVAQPWADIHPTED